MSLLSGLAYLGSGFALALGLAVLFRRRTPSRVSFAIGLFALALEGYFTAVAAQAADSGYFLRYQTWRLLSMAFVGGPLMAFSLTYARSRQHYRPRWKTAILVALGVATPALAVFFRDDLFIAIRPNAFAFETVLDLGWPGQGVHLGLLLMAIVALTNLERTYRASVGTIRWRIKFMVIGLGLILIVRIYTASQALIVRHLDPHLEIFNAGALLTGILVMGRSLFRIGHFETDVYPSPAVLRSSITVIFVGLYLVLIGIVAKVTTHFGISKTLGINAFILLLSLVGLAVILQSERGKLWLRHFVSRHFQRPFYDYRDAWLSFTETTAQQLEIRPLAQALASRVAGLFQANSVSIWLTRPDGDGLACAASTAHSETAVADLRPSDEAAAVVLQYFRSHSELVELEPAPGAWAETLRRLHPKLFDSSGNRFAMPLVCGDHVLGCLIVGDRVNGAQQPFTVQDLDMLRCVGNHAAASLLNLRLSEKVVQSREVEAFQAMAAFFVHDLKNAASTLNLMLPNLPIHWDNPEFREDALRGITKTVGRINALIGRLSELRQELKIHPRTADLNAVIDRAVEAWKAVPGITLEKSLQPLPPLRIDGDQITTVLTNLILNARDAVLDGPNRPGRVSLSSLPIGEFAVVTVSDNGCGMSQNFLNHSLFRPFQTTKKNGLGIGMFQSKMIVEAHGGRLAVESTVGQGTIFRMYLPLASSPSPSSDAGDSR